MKRDQQKRFQDFIVRLLTLDLNEYSKFPAWVIRQIKVTYYVSLEFINDRCLLRASSLTYTTILSIVPLMAVSFSWFSRMKLSEAEVQNFLSQYLFPNAELFNTIQENIDTFSENTAALSTFGTLFLFVTAYSMINTMERSFNEIWHVTEKRSLWEKVSSFWLLLTMAPILIGLSLFMTAKLKSLPVLGTILEYPLIKASLVYIIPFIMILLAFFMLYKLLPYTRVGNFPALGGAAIATVLFMLLKWGFGVYITHFASYSKIYGALAAIPAFLLYIFLVWIIVLLGGEFSYVLQYPELYQRGAAGSTRPEQYKGYLALRFMVEIVRQFRSGSDPASTLDISQKLGIAFELVEKIMIQLKRGGLVRRLEENRDAFVPSRDPEKITVVQVLEAVRGKLLKVPAFPDEPERNVIDHLFHRGRTAFEDHLGNISMNRLVDEVDGANGERQRGPVPVEQNVNMDIG